MRKVLGASLRRFRVARGLKQSDVASRVDVDVRHIRAIETGAGAPSLDVLISLTDALGVSFGALFQAVCFDEVGGERTPRVRHPGTFELLGSRSTPSERRAGESSVDTNVARHAHDLGDLSRVARSTFVELWGASRTSKGPRREVVDPAPVFTIRNDGPDLQLGAQVVRHGSRIVFRRVEAVTRDAVLGVVALVELDEPDAVGERLIVRGVDFDVRHGWSFIGGTTGTTRRAAPTLGAWRAHALAVGTLG